MYYSPLPHKKAFIQANQTPHIKCLIKCYKYLHGTMNANLYNHKKIPLLSFKILNQLQNKWPVSMMTPLKSQQDFNWFKLRKKGTVPKN